MLKCWLPVRGRAEACDSSWAAGTRSQQLGSLRSLCSTSGYSDGVKKDGEHGRLSKVRGKYHCVTHSEEPWFKVAPGRPLGADSSLAAQVLENAQVCMPWLPTSNCLDCSEKRTMKCCGKRECSDCVCCNEDIIKLLFW